MASVSNCKPHAVCVPFPAQGHVNPMLKLAKLLHQNGFFITFVNTEYNHNRLVNSRGPSAVAGLPDFRFEAIPDGLSPTDDQFAGDIPSFCTFIATTFLEPFCDLITKLNSSEPPVSCIVGDGVMGFTVKAAERFGLPGALFWTTSACGVLAYTQYGKLADKGYFPLQDMEQVTNGYLETPIDWISGMKNIRLRDIPSFIRTTDAEDKMFNFLKREVEAIPKSRALILNTFDALEGDVLDELSAMFPRVYAIGPLQLMMSHIQDDRLQSLTSNLWKEDVACIEWLDSMAPNSVVYVNFGSVTVMTAAQMAEFAWGLASSEKPFLWIIRPDIVAGETAILPPEFVAETKDRSMLVSWCPQEQVLNHPAIGGFLTHAGWNSTLETIVGGVPVICWPFFAEQLTNCRYSCVEWGMGMEIDNNVKRDEVALMVKELLDGEKGKKMKKNAMEWKRKAEEAAATNGSSYFNLEKFIKEGLLQ